MKYFFYLFLFFSAFTLRCSMHLHVSVTDFSPLVYFPKVLQILIAQYATEWQLRDTFCSYAGNKSSSPDSIIAFSEDENFITTARYARNPKTDLSREIIASQNIQTHKLTNDYSSYPCYERITLSPTGKYFAHVSFNKEKNWTCTVIDRLKKTKREFILPVTTNQAIESRYLFEDKYFFLSVREAITVFDLHTKTLATWQIPHCYADQLICSPNGRYLYAHVVDFTLQSRYCLLLDIAHQKQIACIPDQEFSNVDRDQLVAAFSPDSSTLTIGGTKLAFYCILSKLDRCQIFHVSAIIGHKVTEKIAITSLCYSQDGAFIALGAGNNIIILHRDQDNTFRPCQIIQVHKCDRLDSVTQLSFSQSSKYLMSGHSGDHIMKLWENYAADLIDKKKDHT